jgi:OmcA/MtrC family decaheme c-type cytochrome
MHTNTLAVSQLLRAGRLLALLLMIAAPAHAQTLAWGAEKYFQYNIENVVVTPTAGVTGSYSVKVIFSVTNPVRGGTWDIKVAEPFQSAGASINMDFAWDPGTDFTNTGSNDAALTSIATTVLGAGAALPVQARGLQLITAAGATACTDVDCPGVASTDGRFWITKVVRPVTFVAPVTRGRVVIEGRPVCNRVDADFTCPPGTTTFVNVPVRSAAADFSFAASGVLPTAARRPIVDIAKCQRCHDDGQHGDVVVPRLSLHGANRNGNLAVCVVCHNPNQTDVPYRFLTAGTTSDPRIGGPETPVDFKTMVHSIHAGGFRETPFVVIGRSSSVNDYSHVRFPSELRNCSSCHVDVNGKGTYELPLAKSVLGTTVKTNSNYLGTMGTTGATRTISVNPADDVKISPTAAVCSSCHDKAEARSHMVRRGGASFATTQAAIGTKVIERCANCHGPGKSKDVRRVHQVSGSGS